MTAFDVVSWDVDGTLYDMNRVKRAVIFAALRGLFSPRIVRNLREMSALGRFRKRMAAVRAAGGVLGPDGIPPERDDIVRFEERWYGPAIRKVGLRPGVQSLIDHFDAEGIKQIVVSDYRSDYKLAVLGLEGRFADIYAGERVGHLKPSVALFHHVIEQQHIDPARILHIGDREDTDGIAARVAGCQVAIIGAEFPSAQHLLETIERKQLTA